jgi:hypothetical protein
MPSSGMRRRVTLVRTEVSEERITSVIRVTRIGEVGTLTNRGTLRGNTIVLIALRTIAIVQRYGSSILADFSVYVTSSRLISTAISNGITDNTPCFVMSQYRYIFYVKYFASLSGD